jgi:hypothetical protein
VASGEGDLLAGRYRLIRRIGAGAMGVVWQGHDERLDRQVAVKRLLLRPDLPPDKAAEALARCLREGRIAARLHHPNAITVFDVVDEDDMPHLVMEYLPSRSLAKAIEEDGPLAPDAAAAIGTQVATALTAAHEAGIVHRDITPANILLGEDGSVKLADFGISRAEDDIGDDAAATRTGRFAGTPAYLAPEVALGTSPTAASDVFSLGATLYTAVEGTSPFGDAPNVFALLHAAAGGEIHPPQRSGPLTDALLALLTADPNARPTAAQARGLLAAAGHDEPAPAVGTATEPVNPQAPVSATGRPHKAMAAAGVFVVVLAALGFWLLGSRTGSTPAENEPPADGKVQNHTTRTSGPTSVTRVGEPIENDDPAAPQAPGSEPAAKPATSDAAVPVTQDTTAAPITTSDDVAEPEPSEPEPSDPPTSEEPPSTPPG